MSIERPRTTREHVLGVLRSEILAGRHPPRSRLRQEEIAARLGVSTTPVREALRDLVAEGLIDLDVHRGALVRGHTIDDVREIYEIRIVLEPMLAVRALQFTTAAQLDEARRIHDALCAEREPERWSALNLVFHRALVASAPEGRLSRLVATLAEAASSYVMLSMRISPALMRSNNTDHAALLRAHRRRDAEGVQARTRAHLEATLRVIEREGAQPGGAPPPVGRPGVASAARSSARTCAAADVPRAARS